MSWWQKILSLKKKSYSCFIRLIKLTIYIDLIFILVYFIRLWYWKSFKITVVLVIIKKLKLMYFSKIQNTDTRFLDASYGFGINVFQILSNMLSLCTFAFFCPINVDTSNMIHIALVCAIHFATSTAKTAATIATCLVHLVSTTATHSSTLFPHLNSTVSNSYKMH